MRKVRNALWFESRKGIGDFEVERIILKCNFVN
jgi:hypothetical protein